jgi:putative acyl-CoA dehydrogenase
MRHAFVQALHHARGRRAFGKLLIDQPLMRGVLCDLYLESEAATMLAVRLARAFDASHGDDGERAFRRMATAIAKYWVCKRATLHVGEALECLGGNGYVEDSVMPRLYRETPVNSIWEGSGNVMCIDVLRAMDRESHTLHAVMGEIRLGLGADPRFDRCVHELEDRIGSLAKEERSARWLVGRLAVLLEASLVLRHGAPALADAFCATRLPPNEAGTFGAFPPEIDVDAVLSLIGH